MLFCRIATLAVGKPQRRPRGAEAIGQRYSVGNTYDDYREMIRREELDILCIATRPGPHVEIAVFAAESGVRGLYCEKPLCNSMRQADAILGACERNGVQLIIAYQRPHHATWLKARELIREGVIGDVIQVQLECGGNILNTIAAIYHSMGDNDRAIVTAGLAKDVDAVNQ